MLGFLLEESTDAEYETDGDRLSFDGSLVTKRFPVQLRQGDRGGPPAPVRLENGEKPASVRICSGQQVRAARPGSPTGENALELTNGRVYCTTRPRT